ncbi:ribosome maturation protein RimP [Aerococcus urinaehominis]|uniref:Ribosome maturation factor RimP n=1 Tax=Aerococcus urinaehominis TaxID=128944 RepID=A0A0X8FK60_9LACT|nr:ribosome maturation factor RimP [Aerococcus urinaehominis]AMB98823.1 ribosome maturation protein RimP [Aerococcus urinaehominis]SDM48841.1 ribosome maturation factor RimP [Aerococcus urinaehominis]
MGKVKDQIQAVVEPIIDGLGYGLFDIDYVKEGKDWFLRIYADKPGGITLEDIVDITEHVSEALDNLDPDPIPHAYMLEVSSPGAERPLKTPEAVQAAIGEWVHLTFYQQLAGSDFIEGRLLAVDEASYRIEIKEKTRRKEVTIDKDKVSLIRLAIEF